MLIMKKSFVIFIVFIGIASVSYGQKGDSIYYEIADTNPAPIGGFEAIYNWIADNVNMSILTKAEHINCLSIYDGKVYVQYTITEQGKLIQPKVIKGIGEPYDSEALRLISKMPINWIPGTKDGNNVKGRTASPISFCTTKKDRKRKKTNKAITF